jgi:hypothetical protein
MIDAHRQQVIVATARVVLGEVAPEELPLLGPISTAYFADPEQALRGSSTRDEPLGFGVPVSGQLLTPVVLAVMSPVVSFLVAEVRKSVQAEAPGVINDLVKSVFKKARSSPASDDDQQTVELSPQQLTQVREIALEKGRQLGLNDERAELLADALVGGLAVSG